MCTNYMLPSYLSESDNCRMMLRPANNLAGLMGIHSRYKEQVKNELRAEEAWFQLGVSVQVSCW